ncbi:MAG: trigger factor family protein, partial [Bacteroidia bacterium]|nr:trigger factor family protein [Bacteroidia bacterium]
MIIHERKKYFDESGITEVDPQSHERYTVALEVEYIFEPEDYLEALEAKCKELRKRANFPGFRPGTAPMHLIKARLGKEVLRELLIEALNQELGSLYYGSRYLALTQPIVFEQPDFKILEGNHTFKAWMNICEDRELILPNREPIEIRAPVDPTEAVIERELRLMAASNGTTETVDPAQAPEAGFEYFIEAAFNPLDNFKNLPQSGQKFQPANPDDASTSQKNRHPLEAFVQALADLDIPIVKQLAEKSPEPDAPLIVPVLPDSTQGYPVYIAPGLRGLAARVLLERSRFTRTAILT